ncbi:hypothetical protein MKX01_042789 [Papaver californicum]|nr:hypothetical protein MKX01_042789 [Papaver californicum]
MAMKENEGFRSAQPDQVLKVHTTHTVLDTDIFPTHPSFDEEGIPPLPAKWKGRCDFNVSECNDKLIGAKSFNKCHGTHTSSTAAGKFVKSVNVLGNANRTAVGMAPYTHLSIYKVFLGSPFAPFYMDSITIGSFIAIQKGIFVSCSVGNSGPLNAALSNKDPWILTVGASTIDRKINATANLGNGIEYGGESLFQPGGFSSTFLPLIYAGADGEPNPKFCGEVAFNKTNVIGKIVLCERGNGVGRIAKGEEVKNFVGAGMILMNQETDGFSTEVDAHILPATHLSFAGGLKIKDYINTSSSPSSYHWHILKLDIMGPGVSILAAWPFSLDNNTNFNLTYNIISGTSMSCPHLSGIAVLLKGSHPDWSPATIKSAMMTTADLMNLKGQPIVDQNLNLANLFATGSGYVNPSKANDPELIYDIQPDSYIPYLCGLGYSDHQVGIIAHQMIKCSEYLTISVYKLNYSSFTVPLIGTTMFTRKVTYVGEVNSTYGIEIVEPDWVSVSVNQKLTYSVMFSRNRYATNASIS